MYTDSIFIFPSLFKPPMPIIPQPISNKLPIHTNTSTTNRSPLKTKALNLILRLYIPKMHFPFRTSSIHKMFIPRIKPYSIHRMQNHLSILLILMAFKRHNRIYIPPWPIIFFFKTGNISSPINRPYSKNIFPIHFRYTNSTNLRIGTQIHRIKNIIRSQTSFLQLIYISNTYFFSL